MFTGIIEEVGTIVQIAPQGDSAVIAVHAPLAAADAKPGDSISVNGVCLTVTALAAEEFTADVMAQTLKMSALGELEIGDRVNLERAMRADSRFGGHIVQGHVDAVAECLCRTVGEHWEVLRFSLPEEIARYLIPQGSITVNGVSLTVSSLGDGWFEVSLIPTTLSATTLGGIGIGDRVNLESDVLARHVERLLQTRPQ